MRVSEGTILGTSRAIPRMTVTGLQIDVIRDKQATLMHLNGCLNIDSSPILRDRLLTILQLEAPEVLTVDLSEVSHVDSSGIATLIEALKIARTRNTNLSLKGLQGRLLQGRVHVEAAIFAEMTNLHTGTTVWTNSVSEAGNLAQRNVPAVVAEMNRTMNRAIEKLLSPLPTSITTKGINVSQGNKECKK